MTSNLLMKNLSFMPEFCMEHCNLYTGLHPSLCPEFSKNVSICNVFTCHVSTLLHICYLDHTSFKPLSECAAGRERLNCVSGLAHSVFIKNHKGVFLLQILVVQITCAFADRFFQGDLFWVNKDFCLYKPGQYFSPWP